MFTVTDSQIIRRAPTAVFEAAADPQAQLKWDADALESVEKLTSGPLARGSRIRARFKALGTVEYEFVVYDPPRTFTWHSALPRWENWHAFDFEAVPDGTRLTQHSTFKLKGPWKLATPLIKRLVTRRLPAMATAIADYLNAGVTA
jgi:hypothetical protein